MFIVKNRRQFVLLNCPPRRARHDSVERRACCSSSRRVPWSDLTPSSARQPWAVPTKVLSADVGGPYVVGRTVRTRIQEQGSTTSTTRTSVAGRARRCTWWVSVVGGIACGVLLRSTARPGDEQQVGGRARGTVAYCPRLGGRARPIVSLMNMQKRRRAEGSCRRIFPTCTRTAYT